MPNKRNLRKWVEALRSGEYEQGHGRLRSEIGGKSTHCCLGVACEVAIADGVSVHFSGGVYNYARKEEETYNLFALSYLPDPVKWWLGLDDRDPIVGQRVGRGPDLIAKPVPATVANDGENWSFSRIADGIEAYYRLLEED